MRLNLLKVLNENFRIKIFITFALLIFFISVSFTSLFIHRQTKNLTDALIKKGNLLAGVLAFNSRIGVFSENKELLDVAAEGILQQEGVLEVSIFNLEGKLLKSKERPQIRTLEKSIRRDEKSKRKAIEEITETVSPCYFVGSSAVEFWSPVISDSDPYEETSLFFKEDLLRRKSKIIGFAMITGDKRTLDKELNDLLVKTIFIGITFLIIGSIVTYIVAKGITKPLNKLIESVKIFGTVGTVEKFPIETKDEIGKLAMAFNNMAESLKRREGALRESEERYRTLFTQASDGICIMSVDGKLVDVNESSARMHGYSTQEIRHINLKDSDAPETFQLAPERMRRVLAGEAITFEVKHYHKDGHVFPLEVSVSLISYSGESYVQCVHRDITERKRGEEMIQASREQMRALAGRLQTVREEERTDIAREIHDELGGALTGMKVDVSFLIKSALKIENEAARTSLIAGMDSVTKSIDTTIHAVRRIAMELRPGILDDLGLVAALEWQLKDFEKRSGIRSEFFPPVEDISLDADLSTALFRIFQEALTNVVRHSGATAVCVRLRADADSSTLEVEDNGKGIEKEKLLSSESLGLLGMRERAQMFGGRITVTGTPGTGTTVKVEIPSVEKRKIERDQGGATLR